MAKIPLILHISTASQGLPGLVYAISRRRSAPAAYIAAGGLISLLSNLVALESRALLGNNQVFSYISSPATLALFLAGLAEWQADARSRRWMRLSIVPMIVVWALLVMFVEDVRNFDLVTGPLYSLTLLVASMWTLLRRAGAVEATPLQESDWYWIALGLAANGACTALSSPIGAILLARGRFDLFNIAWQVRGALSALSYCLVAWGIYLGPSVSKYSTVE